MAHFKSPGEVPQGLSAPPSQQQTPPQRHDPLRAALRSSPKFVRELIAGGVAGGLAKTAVAPLERAKIVFQTRSLSNMGIAGILEHIWKTEGMPGMFRGNGASVLRIVPYAAIHFGAYENYKRFFIEHVMEKSQDQSRGQEIRPVDHSAHPKWDLIAGSAAGATAVILTYPLDLVRTRMAWSTEALKPGEGTIATTGVASSAQHGGVAPAGLHASTRAGATRTAQQSSHAGIFRTLVTIWREESQIVGLYRGVNPTLLGILPYAGLKFYVYQSLKNWFRGLDNSGAPQKSLPAPTATSSPIPTALTPTTTSSASSSPSLSTSQQESSSGEMETHLANAAAASDCVALDSRAPGPGGHTVPVQGPAPGRLPLLLMLSFGGFSGLVAQTVTYPLDVIRRRMQVHGALPAGQRATTWSVGRMIVQQEGIFKGLMRGLSINYLKVVPSTAIGFTVYDYLKEYLDVRGNL